MFKGKIFKNNQGLTLIEVLLSITLLGFVFIYILSYFNQAYSYTNKNESKTVGVNVARNVLHYIEQQDYETIKENFFSEELTKVVVLKIKDCDKDQIGPSTDKVFEKNVCEGFFSSTINNQVFTTEVKLMKHDNPDLITYLIPVEVTVSWNGNSSTVKGDIKNE